MRIPGFERDPKPRLKPGFTWTRLIGFVVVVAVLAVVAEHFAAGTYPPTDCEKRGIDSGDLREGTCFEGNTQIHVVDRHSVLKMDTLEAKLVRIRDRKTVHGPADSKTADGEFVTFELAITNRTNSPAAVVAGQFVLLAGELHGESVELDERYEPKSFLSRHREIAPDATEVGTVTFATSTEGAESVTESGNLDVVNLGTSVPALEPEKLLHEDEYGVIRTYR